jgi:ribonuclease VapC
MMVIDTSVLMAIVKNEPLADECRAVMRTEPQIILSAGTFIEAKVVAAGRGLVSNMDDLLRTAISEIIPVTPERAEQIAAAYTRWGKGIHPAALNFGDCFAYATAIEHACPLLYIGNDFSQTDVLSARLPS